MKKNVYQASFEESKNFVTEKYIKQALNESGKKQVRKRFVGVIVMMLLPIKGSFLFSAVEKYSPYDINILPARLKWVFLLFGFIIFLFAVIKFKEYKNNKILNSFEYNRLMCFSGTLFATVGFLFMCSIANLMLNSYLPSIGYSILLLLFIYHRNSETNKKVITALYQSKVEYTNQFAEKIAFFQKFATKYGGLIVIILFIVKNFLFKGNHENGLIGQILAFLSPLMMLFCFAFIFAMKEEVMQGYYLKKYCEEYRIKYGYSILDWYGPKSKFYKEEINKS
ncbi:hypothetical protein ACSFB8_04005 [Enterococcus faecalis]